MQVEEYLKKHQPVIYKTFLRALENDKLSHAYLISGNFGTPIFEVAKFLAKSIICDDRSPLACNSCITCIRVDSENYPDFIVIDGSKETIKKDMIASLETAFEKEAMEKKGIKIYILNLIENMGDEATNSLLKFLEEPYPNIYAFLTTNNESNILPTIISRCQGFHIKSLNRNEVIADAVLSGVISEDAEFLSYFYNEPNMIEDVVNDKKAFDDYVKAKSSLFDFLNALLVDKREATYIAQYLVGKNLRTKESLRFFIDMLTQVMEDVVSYSYGKDIVLNSNVELIKKLCDKFEDPSEILINLLKSKNLINLNINQSLIIDHLVYLMREE